jgi:hypothetical protein
LIRPAALKSFGTFTPPKKFCKSSFTSPIPKSVRSYADDDLGNVSFIEAT